MKTSQTKIHRQYILFGLAVILALLSVISPAPALAIGYSTTNHFVVAEGETLDSEYWVSTVTGRVDGVVERDLFLLGQDIQLNGSFSNDVWAVGSRISFGGKGQDQVRLAGQVVKVSGKATGGLSVAAETIKCSETTDCGADLFLIGGNVISEGNCRGNARIIGNRVTVNGSYAGDLNIYANDIVISPQASVGGDILYTSPTPLYLPEKTHLGGELIRQQPSTRKGQGVPEDIFGYLLTQGLWLLAAVIVAIPFTVLFPTLVVESVESMRKSAWRCLLTGIGVFILIPILAAIAFGSIVGIPLALIALAFYGMLVYLAKVPVALLVGTLILRIKVVRTLKDLLLVLLAGLVASYLLMSIPVIGGTLQLVIIIYGMGALVAGLLNRRTPKIGIVPPETPDSADRNKDVFPVEDESSKQ